MNSYTAGFDGSVSSPEKIVKIGGWIKKDGQLISTFQRVIGYGTSTLAEYAALLGVVKEARRLNIQDISIIGDSESIIAHVNKIIESDHYGMQIYREKVLYNLQFIKKWKLTFVPRKHNKEADRLTHF